MTISPGSKRRDKNLLDLGFEGDTVHGSIKDEGRGHAAKPECARAGRRFPVPVRDSRVAAFAT